MKNLIIYFTILIITPAKLSAQVWSGFDMKGMLEYEAQRFLMEEVYEVSSEDFELLRVEKLVTETDNLSGGFLFAISAYKYQGKEGVVITSFTPYSANDYTFYNVHLSKEGFDSILKDFEMGENLKSYEGDHFVKRINKSVVIEIEMGIDSEPVYVFWINGVGRHKFGKIGFSRMKKKYNDFFS